MIEKANTSSKGRHFSVRGLACLVWMICALHLQASPASWRQTIWNGEKAWESTSAGWTAIVSEERARLVSLAESGNGGNILFVSTKNAISWGGHRCWLGPQASWKTGWPPPSDWEASPASQVRSRGAVLTVTYQHADPKYPQITRSYEWRDGVLHCSMNWQGESYYAIQILQVPRWSLIHLYRVVTRDCPLGYALPPLYQRPSLLNDRPIAQGASRLDGNELTLWYAYISEKIAVAPQEVIADIGNYRLTVRRGTTSGTTTIVPDAGLLTQLYLGDWQNPFIELEQLSPFGSEHAAKSEILVTLSRKVGSMITSK